MLSRDLPAERNLMNDTLKGCAVFTVLLTEGHAGDSMCFSHLYLRMDAAVDLSHAQSIGRMVSNKHAA